ncbi:hypothetical protein ACIGO7_37900, partial [Streptomyces virginiae]|uniref:hypothetical protein n=1 Tax=Streptomyces virginiae TaxID=1961 RepID=UPI0037D45C8C
YTAALQVLDGLGVHVREKGKHAQRRLPQAVRGKGSLPTRMHCFNLDRAEGHFASDELSGGGPGGEFPGGTTPRDHPGTTGVVPDSEALTCGGTTGTTGTTLELFTISEEGGTTPGTTLSVPAPATSPEEVPGFTEAPAERGQVPAPARMFQPGDERLDVPFLKLAMKAKGRTQTALDFGVLGNGYVYLPNHEPIPAALPENVDQVPELMRLHGLKTLWVHAEAATALSLPTYEDRVADLVTYKGPQGPMPHPWVQPRPGAPVEVKGEGLSSWVTLKAEGGRRLSLAFPLYDDRFDRSDEPARGGWGGAATPQVLLDALMVYLLATRHGSEEWPKVIPYYLSSNATAKDFAGGDDRKDVTSEAIRNRQVPVVGTMQPLVNMQWNRPADAISDDERAMGWLHQYDKNAAWLAAIGSAWLGIGDPTH